LGSMTDGKRRLPEETYKDGPAKEILSDSRVLARLASRKLMFEGVDFEAIRKGFKLQKNGITAEGMPTVIQTSEGKIILDSAHGFTNPKGEQELLFAEVQASPFVGYPLVNREDFYRAVME